MKEENKTYTDVSKVGVYLISCNEARPIIVNNHYSHKWTMCRFAYGVYYDSKLIGCIVYGSPIGRLAAMSITKTIKLDRRQVLELTRLWIADGYGTNIESYSLAQTFKYLREIGVRVLLSYADPNVGHIGKIYQATNWLYQGNETMQQPSNKFTILGEVLHPRTVSSRYGSHKDEVLKKIDPNYKKEELIKKHRYIYILDKKNRKKILSDLKHPIKEYV